MDKTRGNHDKENPELTFSHGCTKVTAVYTTVDENDLKTSGKDLLQLKIERRTHNKKVGGAETLCSQTPHIQVGIPQTR